MASQRYRWVVGSTVFAIFFLFLFQYHDTALSSFDTAAEAPVGVDWSRFAYIQYATNSDYLCNSLMFFEALHRFSSPADRALMYPSDMLLSEDEGSKDARLLIKARDEYDVKLVPVAIEHREDTDGKSCNPLRQQ